MSLLNGDLLEILGIDTDTGDRVGVTVYLKCKNCELFEWYHPGGRCLYTPHKFEPRVSGAYGIGVSKDKGIFYVSYFTAERAMWKYPETTVLLRNAIWPHTEVVYWCHYLTEIGWKL